jgi:Heterokaryon incompatibility protein (HET)
MSIRLLNTDTLKLEEFFDSKTPPYVILSHTWGNEEVSFIEMQRNDVAIGSRLKEGFKKISNFCAMAKRHGFTYGWADSCCIDKRNSAELSEAINSMYRYYYNAAECLVYLEDVPAKINGAIDQVGQLGAIKSSRWFTRGWTLQELIAPKVRHFFAGDWSPIENCADFNKLVAEVTSIDEQVLENRDMLSNFCVAQRMSWASRRQTTRSEDIAYSLMGLFNVNMPVIYGEGATKAFRRLQTEIMQTSFDQTIFAWHANYESSGLLATSPADFFNTPQLGLWDPVNLSPFVMTNVGLSIRLNLIKKSEDGVVRHTSSDAQVKKSILAALQCDVKVGTTWKILMVYLEPIENARFFVNGKSCKAYRRIRCAEWLPVAGKELAGWPYEDVLVLQDEHYQLLKRSIEDNRKRWETSS